MIFWCLIGLALVTLMQQLVQNRRTKRYNRNADRYNEMMEKLQQKKETDTDDN